MPIIGTIHATQSSTRTSLVNHPALAGLASKLVALRRFLPVGAAASHLFGCLAHAAASSARK